MQHRSALRCVLLPDRPSRAVLDLGALPTAPGCARAWTRRVLREWQLTVLSDSAEIVVSELTTNAMLASRPPGAAPPSGCPSPLTKANWLSSSTTTAPGTPEPRNAGDEHEDGRGLLLVEAVSSRSGWYTV